jgi:hypothetical protein
MRCPYRARAKFGLWAAVDRVVWESPYLSLSKFSSRKWSSPLLLDQVMDIHSVVLISFRVCPVCYAVIRPYHLAQPTPLSFPLPNPSVLRALGAVDAGGA